ncbi:hypothetical protein G9A89_012843 [Geosiphon pyriformis]|nr:hypothetical protein G9A89_012843 [Geosiphon pyriformis]
MNSKNQKQIQRLTHVSRVDALNKENLPKSSKLPTKKGIPVSTNNTVKSHPGMTSSTASRSNSLMKNPSRISNAPNQKKPGLSVSSTVLTSNRPSNAKSSILSKSKNLNIPVMKSENLKRVTFASNVVSKAPVSEKPSIKEKKLGDLAIPSKLKSATGLFSNLSRETKQPSARINPNLSRPLRNNTNSLTATKKCAINGHSKKPELAATSQSSINHTNSKIRGLKSVRRLPSSSISVNFKPDATALAEIISSESSRDIDRKRANFVAASGLRFTISSTEIKNRSSRLSQTTTFPYAHRVEKHRESQHRASLFGGALRVSRPIRRDSQKPLPMSIGNTLPIIRESLVIPKSVSSTNQSTGRQSLLLPRNPMQRSFMGGMNTQKPGIRRATISTMNRNGSYAIGSSSTNLYLNRVVTAQRTTEPKSSPDQSGLKNLENNGVLCHEPESFVKDQLTSSTVLSKLRKPATAVSNFKLRSSQQDRRVTSFIPNQSIYNHVEKGSLKNNHQKNDFSTHIQSETVRSKSCLKLDQPERSKIPSPISSRKNMKIVST